MARNMLSDWVKKLSEKLQAGGSRRSHRLCSLAANRQARKIRPKIETLEDRLTPSGWVVTDSSGGAGSASDITLPYAVSQAQNGDTITFASSLSGATINLSGVLSVTTNITITGLGASSLAVSGGGSTGIFNIASGVTVNISGLTIENGSSSTGSGIYNSGTLTLSNATFSGNAALGPGTDIDNASGGTIVAGANAFNSSTNINDNGTLDLDGNSNAMGSLNGASTGTIIDSGAAATLTVSGGGSFSGNITGANTALIVGGSTQTLLLLGNDSYGGLTTINSGDTLQLGSSTALSASSNLSNSGTLNMGGYSDSIGALSGNGTITNILHQYQIDNGNGAGLPDFNNTLINEYEDNWVGNVFTSAPGGTELQSIAYFTGFNTNLLPSPYITAALYTGSRSGVDACARLRQRGGRQYGSEYLDHGTVCLTAICARRPGLHRGGY